MNTPGYESLASVLNRAYDQAAKGKGHDRHAVDRPFTEQPMQTISELLGTPNGLLYQAMKKIQESKRLDRDAGIRELLGAINYLAGAVIFLEAERQQPAAVAGRPTHYSCCCGHPPLEVPVGQACPQCDPPRRGDTFRRVVNPATGLTTHWACTNDGTLVAIGNACPVCFATM